MLNNPTMPTESQRAKEDTYSEGHYFVPHQAQSNTLTNHVLGQKEP